MRRGSYHGQTGAGVLVRKGVAVVGPQALEAAMPLARQHTHEAPRLDRTSPPRRPRRAPRCARTDCGAAAWTRVEQAKAQAGGDAGGLEGWRHLDSAVASGRAWALRTAYRQASYSLPSSCQYRSGRVSQLGQQTHGVASEQ
jgi:hypothetical protein